MKKITYNGKVLNVPMRYFHDNLLNRFQKNTYEKEEVYLSQKYFDKSDNVLELGSCLGYISCILSDKVGSIISVEANPELKPCLIQTKKDNNLSNVEFLNTYIDIEHKVIDFQTYDNIVAGSGDREDLEINNTRGWGDTLKMYKINTSTLNDIVGIDKVNALVIDIEGGELSFLRNNQDFLKKNIKKICIELHGHLMRDPTFDKQCVSAMNDIGFVIKEKMGITYYFENNIKHQTYI